MWGKIETWAEHHFPSFVSFTHETSKPSYDPADPRSRIVDRYRDLQVLEARRARGQDVDVEKPTEVGRSVPWQLYAFVLGMTLFLFVVAAVSVWGMLWVFAGERVTWEELGVMVEGKLNELAVRFAVAQEQAQTVVSGHGRKALPKALM
jgi:farnesyl-diphosphate farnesyltransferase